MTAMNCLRKAIHCLLFMPKPGGKRNEGIKLPSQGKRLHKQGNFMPSSGYPPRQPFK